MRSRVPVLMVSVLVAMLTIVLAGCSGLTDIVHALPVANAGSAQTVAVGATVKLDASKSNDPDGDKLSYSWSLVTLPSGSKAKLSGAQTSIATFLADVSGLYVAQVMVSDKTSTSTAQTTVTAISANLPPTANAGSNQTVATGSVVQLNGSLSKDLDGDTLSYAWTILTEPRGSKASLSGSSTVNPTFTADLPGTYTIQLTVNDGTSNASSQVTVIANSPPTANAGANQSVAVGATVQLDGSKSGDPDGDSLTYSWTLSSLPAGSKATLTASTSVSPTFVADVAGNFIVQLTVSDGTFTNTSKVSIVAGMAAQTALLVGGTPTFWSSNGSLFVIFPVYNNGTGVAGNVQITSVALSSQGVAVAAPLTKPASLPIVLGDLNAGASTLADTSFNGANLTAASQYLLSVSGTYQSNGTATSFNLRGNVTYGTTSVFEATPDPINVTVTTDSTHASSGTITAASGGTLTTTGADGTVFTLTVPANALLADEPVTMTPITSAVGLPISGGFAAGVQLEPEGLQLFQMAKLTIQPTASIPAGQLVGFGYQGAGQDVYLYPLDPISTISFSIIHFSGYGVGSGTAQAPSPANTPAQLINAIVQLLAQPISPSRVDALVGLFQEYYDLDIVPAIQDAQAQGVAGNFDVADIDVSRIIGFEKTAEMLGISDQLQLAESGRALNLLKSLSVEKYNWAYQNCISRANPLFVRDMLAAARQLVLLGADPSALFGDYSTAINNCASGIKISFSMDDDVKQTFSIDGLPSTGGFVGLRSGEAHVQANNLALDWTPNPNKWDPQAGGFPGDFRITDAPFNYLSLTYVNDTIPVVTCTTLVSNSTGNMITVDAWPDFNVKSGPVTLNIAITVHSGEVWLLGSVSPSNGSCQTLPPPTTAPFYQLGFNVAGGQFPFTMPLNSGQRFSLLGSVCNAPACDNAQEVRTITNNVIAP